MTFEEMTNLPVFGVGVTCAAYGIFTLVQRRWRWAHALVGTCGSVILLLVVMGVPYAHYKVGGDWISFLLGPATIALGVPMYTQARKIRRQLMAIGAAVLAGSITGMASAGVLAWSLGGSRGVMLAMIPKSVTTPISMEVSRGLGAQPEVTAVFTVLAGLLGSVAGPWVLRVMGVKGEMALGVGIGTSSHGIGTARLLRESELAGGVSGLAMAVAGVMTAVLAVPVQYWVGTR